VIPYAKKSLTYLTVLILFVFIILLSKDLLFTQASGSSSGTVTATVTVNPIKIDARARPHSPFVNKKFTVRATVKNLGSTTLNNVEATIFLPAELTPLSDENQFLGSIDGDRKKRASWTIQADEAGHHIIIVAISAIDSATGTPVANQANIMVEVREKPGKGMAALWDFLLNMFR